MQLRTIANLLYLEKRDAEGKMLLGQGEPPFMYCTLDDLFKHYFLNNPNTGDAVSQEEIAAWYHAQELRWRPVYWQPSSLAYQVAAPGARKLLTGGR